MLEHLHPLNHLRRARKLGREVLLAAADRLDTRYADALNTPEYTPVELGFTVEPPVATEEELSA